MHVKTDILIDRLVSCFSCVTDRWGSWLLHPDRPPAMGDPGHGSQLLHQSHWGNPRALHLLHQGDWLAGTVHQNLLWFSGWVVNLLIWTISDFNTQLAANQRAGFSVAVNLESKYFWNPQGSWGCISDPWEGPGVHWGGFTCLSRGPSGYWRHHMCLGTDSNGCWGGSTDPWRVTKDVLEGLQVVPEILPGGNTGVHEKVPWKTFSVSWKCLVGS